MSNYRTLLAADPTRLGAIDALIVKLEEASADVPGKFVEASRNLRLEDGLDVDFWKEVADFALDRGLTLPHSQVEQEMVRICRLYTRKGDVVTIARTYHGRAISAVSFIQNLEDQGLPRTMAQLVAASLPTHSAAETRVALRFQELGGHGIMWSTYCEACDCDDPFTPRLVHAELIDALGLRFRDSEQFLLFTYKIPVRTIRYRPTTADAYGGEFYFAFRTNSGRTHPIRYPDRLSGRCEVVHKAIMGRHIARPVELIEPRDSDVRVSP